MERLYKIERDLEDAVSLAMEQAKTRIVDLIDMEVTFGFDKENKIKREINCLYIGGKEKQTIELYPLYREQIIPIRDTKGRPYKTITGVFQYGRNNDLCYVSDNYAYYFNDFNKLYVKELIDWYKSIFGQFE